MTERKRAEEALKKKAPDRGVGHSDGILGNHVETDRMLLEATRSAPGFRGTSSSRRTSPDSMPNSTSAGRRSAHLGP